VSMGAPRISVGLAEVAAVVGRRVRG